MNKLAILAATVLAAGCATQPQVSLETRIATASNAQLCEAVFYAPPHVAQPADAEAVRRGVNCRDYMGAIATQRAQQEANRAAAARMLMQRPALQQPRRTNCTSHVIGDQVHTSCF